MFFKPIDLSDFDLKTIIAAAIGGANETKIEQVIASYKDANKYLIGAYDSTDKLISLIGIEKIGDSGIIKHIATCPIYRGQGLAKMLISHVIIHFKLKTIKAHTDDEAIGFYKKINFKCTSFISKWGNTRYNCIWHI